MFLSFGLSACYVKFDYPSIGRERALQEVFDVLELLICLLIFVVGLVVDLVGGMVLTNHS